MTEAGLCAPGGTAQVVHQKDQRLNLWTLGVASVLRFRKNRCLPRKILETPTLHLYKQCQGKEKKTHISISILWFIAPNSMAVTFIGVICSNNITLMTRWKELNVCVSLLVMFVTFHDNHPAILTCYELLRRKTFLTFQCNSHICALKRADFQERRYGFSWCNPIKGQSQ